MHFKTVNFKARMQAGEWNEEFGTLRHHEISLNKP